MFLTIVVRYGMVGAVSPEAQIIQLQSQLKRVEAERDLLLEKDPKVRLDGYRELGVKCARLEDERDEALARERKLFDTHISMGPQQEVLRLRDERDALVAELRQLFKIHVSDGTSCHFEQAGGPGCVNDAHHRPPTYNDWMGPQREVMRLQNELTLSQASAAGAGSLLLDVQQDCIKAVKQVSALTEALKDALWVCDHLGDTLNAMDVAGEDEDLEEVTKRMNRARATLEATWESPDAKPSGREEFLEEFLAELCEHVGTVIEPEFVTKIRNLLTPNAWDPNYEQGKKCVCGHTYDRHFDSYEDMAPVGCKYCGSDCEMFRPAASPCPRCDDDARGVLLSPNVWTVCPACKRGGP